MRDAETRTVSINDVTVSYAVTSVTASADDGNKPENVIDGDYNTRWSAQSAYCMLTLELPQLLPIGYVGLHGMSGMNAPPLLKLSFPKTEPITILFSKDKAPLLLI